MGPHVLIIAVLVLGVFSQINPLYKKSITVFHEYEPKFESLGLENQNSGDLHGDAFFVLRSFLLPVECASHNPLAKFDCDNPEQNNTKTNVISKHVVDVDSRFGVYGRCNVVNDKSYTCSCGKGLFPVPCNASVGQADVASRYNSDPPKPKDQDWQWWRVNLARKIGGKWYSTIKKGECPQNPTSACYWHVNQTVRRIASECLLQRVGQAVVQQNTTCFDACSQPTNSSTVCFSRCFMHTLLSPKADNHLIGPTDGVPNTVVEKAWDAAFDSSDPSEGGCPDA